MHPLTCLLYTSLGHTALVSAGGEINLILQKDTPPQFQIDMVLVKIDVIRSEEHTSELQSLSRISYAVFCLKKKNYIKKHKLMDIKIEKKL